VNVDVFVASVLDTASGVGSAPNIGLTYETSNSINVGKFLSWFNNSQNFNKNMAEHGRTWQNIAAERAALLLHIREVLGSELGSEVSYTDVRFSLFVSA